MNSSNATNLIPLTNNDTAPIAPNSTNIPTENTKLPENEEGLPVTVIVIIVFVVIVGFCLLLFLLKNTKFVRNIYKSLKRKFSSNDADLPTSKPMIQKHTRPDSIQPTPRFDSIKEKRSARSIDPQTLYDNSSINVRNSSRISRPDSPPQVQIRVPSPMANRSSKPPPKPPVLNKIQESIESESEHLGGQARSIYDAYGANSISSVVDSKLLAALNESVPQVPKIERKMTRNKSPIIERKTTLLKQSIIPKQERDSLKLDYYFTNSDSDNEENSDSNNGSKISQSYSMTTQDLSNMEDTTFVTRNSFWKSPGDLSVTDSLVDSDTPEFSVQKRFDSKDPKDMSLEVGDNVALIQILGNGTAFGVNKTSGQVGNFRISHLA